MKETPHHHHWQKHFPQIWNHNDNYWFVETNFWEQWRLAFLAGNLFLWLCFQQVHSFIYKIIYSLHLNTLSYTINLEVKLHPNTTYFSISCLLLHFVHTLQMQGRWQVQNVAACWLISIPPQLYMQWFCYLCVLRPWHIRIPKDTK